MSKRSGDVPANEPRSTQPLSKRLSGRGLVLALSLLTALVAGCGSSTSSSTTSSSAGTQSSAGTPAAATSTSTAASSPASNQPAASATELAKYTNCTSSGKPKNPNLTVAFAQTDLNTPWRVTELGNFKLWVQKLCIPHFIWNQANEDVSTELSNVSDLLAKKPTVIILDPEATKPLDPAISMAAKAGVPIVVVDRALSINPGTDTYHVFIGTPQFPLGYNAAKAWITKLKRVEHTNNPKADFVTIDGGVGQDPAIGRHNGVLAAIKPYPGIKLVAAQSGDWTRPGGRTVMQAFLQRFPAGSLKGVYTASDEEFIGAQQALQAAGRTDLKGWFFTSDGQLQGLQGVIAGTNVADSQNPPLYGEPGLQAAIAISQGVQFHAATYDLVANTFDCLTAADCAKTKAYVAKIQLAGTLF